MPKTKRRQVAKGHLWEVTSNSDLSVVNVRVGCKLVAQVPGPVKGILRLDGGRLLLTFRNHAPVEVDLHTGDVQTISPTSLSRNPIGTS